MAKEIWKPVILLLVVLLILGLFVLLGGPEFFSVANLKANIDRLEVRISENIGLSLVIYWCLFLVLTTFLPVAAVMTVAAGFLFSFAAGFLISVSASTVSALLTFLFTRYWAGHAIQARFSDRLRRFNEAIALHGYGYMLMIRLASVFPFPLINTFAGLTRIPVRTFLWTAVLGCIPGSLVSAFAGRQLGRIEKFEDILSWPIIGAFVLLIALVAASMYIRKRRLDRNEHA